MKKADTSLAVGAGKAEPSITDNDASTADSCLADHEADKAEHSVTDDDAGKAEPSPIGRWYAGRSVLVTGATGFLGSVLVEKLLRGCPDIETVYVLVRGKSSQLSAAARVKKLLEKKLFEGHTPYTLAKVVGIPGDISQPGLDLDPQDRALLRAEVTVVFHSAASINFNAALVSAMQTNLLGTQRVLELCRGMDRLECLVYVSTAYCNCTRDGLIEERVFQSEHTPDHVIRLMEEVTSEEFVNMTPGLIGKHPNTYSFTKLLAENLLANDKSDIPIAVVRPTIVLSTLREPMPGWVDNVSSGGFAFMAGASRGIFRSIMADGDKVADFVPCDHVTNLMIAAAWRAGNSKSFEKIQVYQCSTGQKNPLKWGEYIPMVMDLVREYPCDLMFWYPGAKIRRAEWRNDLALYLLQILPAQVAEVVCWVSGMNIMKNTPVSRSSLLAIQQKYVRGQKHTSFFTRRQWQFDTSASRRLAAGLATVDRKLYDFDAAAVRWPDFLKANVFGLRHIFHKESPGTMEASRRRLRWWRLLNLGAYACLWLAAAMLAFTVMGDVIVACVAGTLVTLFMVWL